MNGRRLTAFGACLALSVANAGRAPLNAQRLFGSVVLADDRTPAFGAVVSVIDSAGALVGRDIATSRGDYVIPVSKPGKYALTVRHIGSQDVRVSDVEVAPSRDVRTRIVLTTAVPRPPQVTARTRGVCDLASDSTGLRTLWDQFLTALLSNEVAEQARVFTATWEVREQTIDANVRDTSARSEASERLALDVPVFPMLRPDSSERLGFMIESNDGVRYFTPGMATFRSPTFAAKRCFAFEPAPEGQPSWIGVHFWATGYRIGISEIEGTVWFDAVSLEPRSLTYLYGGLPPSFAAARAGGGMRLARVSTGHWIADEWTLRVPSGRYTRMFAYDTRGNPNGYGNLKLDGVRATTARLTELTVNGTPIIRRP